MTPPASSGPPPSDVGRSIRDRAGVVAGVRVGNHPYTGDWRRPEASLMPSRIPPSSDDRRIDSTQSPACDHTTRVVQTSIPPDLADSTNLACRKPLIRRSLRHSIRPTAAIALNSRRFPPGCRRRWNLAKLIWDNEP